MFWNVKLWIRQMVQCSIPSGISSRGRSARRNHPSWLHCYAYTTVRSGWPNLSYGYKATPRYSEGLASGHGFPCGLLILSYTRLPRRMHIRVQGLQEAIASWANNPKSQNFSPSEFYASSFYRSYLLPPPSCSLNARYPSKHLQNEITKKY